MVDTSLQCMVWYEASLLWSCKLDIFLYVFRYTVVNNDYVMLSIFVYQLLPLLYHRRFARIEFYNWSGLHFLTGRVKDEASLYITPPIKQNIKSVLSILDGFHFFSS